MAVRRYAPINIASASLSAHPVYFVCDTTAELPSSGLKLGDTALTLDTNTQYKAASSSTWSAAGGGGGAGTPASTVVAATSYGQSTVVGVDSDYAREDHSHGSVAHDSHVLLTGVTVDQHHTRDHGPAQHTGMTFSRNATFYDATAVTATTILTWLAPYACTVTAIKGYRVGGTGATINAYRNTTGSPLRSANLSLASASTWTDGGAVQNTAFALGDSLLFGLASVTGSVTQVNIQIDMSRP